MAQNESLPGSDDVQVANGQTEQELLDAVMKSSPIMEELAPPLPTEETSEVDPVESDIEDPEESEEIVSEEEEVTEEAEEEVEGEDAVEETATQEPDTYTAEDLDLDAKVKVKIDGEEMDVSFADLIKGYQTDSHLSKQGRELGEARKALDKEREEKLGELNNMAQASAAMLAGTEQALAKEYHDLEGKIEKARKDGDTFELGELKDQRELAQKKYWEARQQREGMLEAVAKQQAEAQQKVFNEQMEHFHKEIPNLIPDFNEKMATDIREFALKDIGLNPAMLDTITDPTIVKALNDFRILKNQVSKGTAKRKVVPAKKAIPTKKAPPATKKKMDAEKMVKARAFKEGASESDQMDFLRSYASKSLNNI